MMKAVRRVLPFVSFALFLLLPFCIAVGHLAAYEYELLYAAVYAGLLTLVSLLTLLTRENEPSFAQKTVYLLLSPSALVSGIAMLPRTDSRLALILMTAAAIFAFVLLFLTECKFKLKIPLAIVCTVGMSALLLLNFMGILLYGSSVKTTEAYPSPDYSLVAEVYVVDQGVMGGSVELSVRRNTPPVRLLLGCFKPEADSLFFSDYSALPETGELEWTDSTHLNFCGETYGIEP